MPDFNIGMTANEAVQALNKAKNLKKYYKHRLLVSFSNQDINEIDLLVISSKSTSFSVADITYDNISYLSCFVEIGQQTISGCCSVSFDNFIIATNLQLYALPKNSISNIEDRIVEI